MLGSHVLVDLPLRSFIDGTESRHIVKLRAVSISCESRSRQRRNTQSLSACSPGMVCRMTFYGGSQGELRAYNEEQILRFIRDNPGCTQLDIARGIGLTRAAVAKLIGPDPGDGNEPVKLRRVLAVTSDRPARHSLRGDLGFVMTVDLGGNHVRLRSANLLGEPLLPMVPDRSVDVVAEPERALNVASTMMEEAIESSGFRREGLAGIAVGVPFPVRQDGVVLAPGEWRYVQLPSSLWQHLDWRSESVVWSDANLGAVAELEAALRDPSLRGLTRDTDLIYVKWSSAVTGAVITGGRLHRGYGGMAGQFPHVSSAASVTAIVESLGNDPLASELRDVNAEERASKLVARARSGDVKCEKLLKEAARMLGRALGPMINTVNPRLVIVGGAFKAADYSYLSKSLHEGVEETTFQAALKDAMIQSGRCTGSAAVQGGLAVALREFAVPHLRRLAASPGLIPSFKLIASG
jgi:predicted NBD/HSP70 family sugar kinase